MQHVIFYSWQSDLPNNTNRGLIQAALEEAAKQSRTTSTSNPSSSATRKTSPAAPTSPTPSSKRSARATSSSPTSPSSTKHQHNDERPTPTSSSNSGTPCAASPTNE